MDFLRNLLSSIPDREDAVMNSSGKLVCPTCGDPVTMQVFICGKMRQVPVACTCRVRGWKESIAAQRALSLSQTVARCFEGSPGLEKCKFKTDDQSDIKASRACLNYAKDFQEMLEDGQGLLLMGNPGTGKSFLASAIANEVMQNDYTARVLNMATLANRLFSASDKIGFIERECQYHLLVLDDFGAERDSQFALEATYQIINHRYNTAMPMVITTNLSSAAFKNLPVEKQRIYDRILERCYPIVVNGENRRRSIALERRKRMEELLMEV